MPDLGDGGVSARFSQMNAICEPLCEHACGNRRSSVKKISYAWKLTTLCSQLKLRWLEVVFTSHRIHKRDWYFGTIPAFSVENSTLHGCAYECAYALMNALMENSTLHALMNAHTCVCSEQVREIYRSEFC